MSVHFNRCSLKPCSVQREKQSLETKGLYTKERCSKVKGKGLSPSLTVFNHMTLSKDEHRQRAVDCWLGQWHSLLCRSIEDIHTISVQAKTWMCEVSIGKENQRHLFLLSALILEGLVLRSRPVSSRWPAYPTPCHGRSRGGQYCIVCSGGFPKGIGKHKARVKEYKGKQKTHTYRHEDAVATYPTVGNSWSSMKTI